MGRRWREAYFQRFLPAPHLNGEAKTSWLIHLIHLADLSIFTPQTKTTRRVKEKAKVVGLISVKNQKSPGFICLLRLMAEILHHF